MKELEPLLREGASDFERQLLSAAARERPSRELQAQMRHGLGLSGTIVWAARAKALLTALTGKTAAVVLLGGAMAAGGAVWLLDEREPVPAGNDRAAAAVPSAPEVPAAEAAADPAPAPEAAPLEADPAGGSTQLREEISLLDQVRAAVRRGSGAAALQLLDEYRQRFPGGILSREAQLLREQASARASSRGRARPPR